MPNTKTITVEVDDMLKEACLPFDYTPTGTNVFEVPEFNAPARDGSWGIGLIVGPSGSGKTTLLQSNYGITAPFTWNPAKAVASQVDHNKLMAVGLNSVPTWCKPFHVLSNGEAFRANMGALLASNTSYDEFTSVVDRNVAKSCSNAIQRYIREHKLTGVVFSSCHYDIIEWLKPDWCYDIQKGLVAQQGFFRNRQPARLEVRRCDKSLWRLFRGNHYLSGELNNACHAYACFWDNQLVGFCAVLPFPNGNLKNAWRGHRTVILPDYQGLGIGVKLSDFVARSYVERGCRFFSKTAHPRMGEYRERSPNWKPTSMNKKARKDYLNEKSYGQGIETKYKALHAHRLCYSHEYIIT